MSGGSYVAFAYIDKGKPIKPCYKGRPMMIHPEKKPVWGLLLKGPSTLSYDHTRRDDKARLDIHGCKIEKELSGPVEQKIWLPHCYCVFIQRNPAHNAKDGPLLTMHEFKTTERKKSKRYNSPTSRLYAREVRFSGDIRLLFTDVPHGAYLGSPVGDGAYLWIETQAKPSGLPRWHSYDELKEILSQSC